MIFWEFFERLGTLEGFLSQLVAPVAVRQASSHKLWLRRFGHRRGQPAKVSSPRSCKLQTWPGRAATRLRVSDKSAHLAPAAARALGQVRAKLRQDHDTIESNQIKSSRMKSDRLVFARLLLLLIYLWPTEDGQVSRDTRAGL